MDGKPPLAQPETDPMERVESMPLRRPFGVTLLLWLVLSLSAWGLVRLVAVQNYWLVLSDGEARLGPWYMTITGGIWALVGLFLLWSIWSARRWSYWAIPLGVFLWLLQYWFERIFFQQPRANLTFSIIVSILALAITCTSALNRRSKKFLTKSEEHEQPEEHSTSS